MFEGSNQYAGYLELFMKLVKDNMNELNIMGVVEGGLGTHSCRKGVASMVAEGCTVYPPIV